jgi:hypothetical protein
MNSGVRFESVDPSVVRSIKQVDLLKAWLRLCVSGRSAAPSIADFVPDRMAEEQADLVYYRVDWNDRTPRIVIDRDGSRIAEAYGAAGDDHYGQDLATFLGPEVSAHVLPAYLESIRRVRPVYTIADVEDVVGHLVACERLLLPFSDGGAVNRLIASVKTISEDGRFQIRNLLHGGDRQPTFRLRGVVDREVKRRPAAGAIPDGDVIEL